MSDSAPKNEKSDAAASSSDNNQILTSGQQSRSSGSKIRKNVTRACENCKQSKAKCNGAHPCDRCTEKNIPCELPRAEDRRSRQYNKRKLDQLEEESEFLHALLAKIRNVDDVEIAQIISLIRSNASLEEVHACLSQMSQQAETKKRHVSPEIDQMRHTTNAAMVRRTGSGSSASVATRKQVFGVDRLVDTPIYSVPAAPWTSVTEDEHLVSHLISLWSTWYHIFPDGILMEHFLQGMRSKDPKSTFCSPFLVNCILGMGCILSDYEETKTEGGRQSAMLDKFVEEARMHLQQDDSVSITNLQGLVVLFNVVSWTNNDRLGYSYATQANNMCAELMRPACRNRILRSARSQQEEQEITTVLEYAIWGAFIAVTASFMTWRRPQIVPVPVRTLPTSSNSEVEQDLWIPYPRTEVKQKLYMNHVMQCWADLSVICRDLTFVIFSDLDETSDQSGASAKIRSLDEIDVKMTSGYEMLPDHFHSDDAPPSAILLRAWWLSMIITVLSAVQGELSEVSDRSAKISSRLLAISLELVSLSRCTRRFCNNDKLSAFNIHGFFQALNIFLEADATGTYDEEIIEIITTFRAMSRRAPFMVSLLRMVQLDVQRRNIRLPSATEKLFEDFEKQDLTKWRLGPQTSLYFANPFPGAASASEDPETTEARRPEYMGEFLEVFDNLTLHS